MPGGINSPGSANFNYQANQISGLRPLPGQTRPQAISSLMKEWYGPADRPAGSPYQVDKPVVAGRSGVNDWRAGGTGGISPVSGASYQAPPSPNQYARDAALKAQSDWMRANPGKQPTLGTGAVNGMGQTQVYQDAFNKAMTAGPTSAQPQYGQPGGFGSQFPVGQAGPPSPNLAAQTAYSKASHTPGQHPGSQPGNGPYATASGAPITNSSPVAQRSGAPVPTVPGSQPAPAQPVGGVPIAQPPSAAVAGQNPARQGDYSTSIDTGPMFDQGYRDRMAAQINTAAAQQAATAQRQLGNRFSSSDFGTNSPAYQQAVQQSNDSINNATRMALPGMYNGMQQQDAQHLLATQQARAQEGLGLGNQLTQLEGIRVADDASRRNSLFDLMGGVFNSGSYA